MTTIAEDPAAELTVPSRATWVRDLILIAVVGSLWFGAVLGIRLLNNPDEGRYAEIPREMAATGDWITPRLNGVKYFEKPPLLYWLSALTFRVAGCNEFTARIWNALVAVGGLLATYAAARAMYGRAAGWFAGIGLATTMLYYGLSQVLLLDMAASATMAAALFAFAGAMRMPAGKWRHLLLLGCYASMALATLSKGLIGIVLPGAVIFVWSLVLNQWRRLRPFHPFTGGALYLAIAAPWHWLAAKANPGFLDFYFVHEHFDRFTTKVHGRTGPWWYFLAVLVVGLLPWAGFAWPAVRGALAGGWRNRHANANEWFLSIWVVVIVAFFSASQSKLVPYILPVWPPLAVMIGKLLATAWLDRSTRLLRGGAFLFTAVALLFVVGAWLAPAPAKEAAAKAAMLPWRWLFTVVPVAGAGTCLWSLHRNRPGLTIASVAVTAAVLLTTFNPLADRYDRRSTKNLAAILRPVLKAGDRVYSVGFYPQDLPFYLGRLIHVVNYQGELAYGIAAEADVADDRFLRDGAFADQWGKPGVAYVVINRDYYHWRFLPSGLPHKIVAESRRILLLTNQVPSSEP